MQGGAGSRRQEGALSASMEKTGLSMYAESPEEEISLEDFEIWSFQRLKVLRDIEQARSRGLKQEETDKVALDSVKRHMPDGLDCYEGFRKDLVSHHILRLAFCNSEDKRRQFLEGEKTLFKARLSRLTPSQTEFFTRRHGLALTPLSADERMELAVPLRQLWDAVGGGEEAAEREAAEGAGASASAAPALPASRRFEATDYFKVPFLQAADLLRSRKVLLRGGMAYVPKGRTIAILVNRFSVYIKAGLAQANKALPALLADERIKPVLNSMASAYTGPEVGGRKGPAGDIRAENVEELSATAFALCMSNLQDTLKASSHLKHWGRQQYGLFLKGIGLSLEEALVFWQRAFTRKMSVDDFLKKYAYNIRHNYGKEGKRADYTAYPCTRIIMGAAPGVEDSHGCPYKHWTEARLKAVLERQRLSPPDVDKIMGAVRDKAPQVACRMQFEARYVGADSGPVGNHPNAYFDAAVSFLKAKAVEEGKGSSSSSSSSSSSGSGSGGSAKQEAGGFQTTTTAVGPSGGEGRAMEE